MPYNDCTMKEEKSTESSAFPEPRPASRQALPLWPAPENVVFLKRRAVWLFAGGLLLLWFGVIVVLNLHVGGGDGIAARIVGVSVLLTVLAGWMWRYQARLLDALTLRDARIAELTDCDPMTGALNHAAFMESLSRDVLRSLRYGHVLTVMRLDIDFFKRINDGYGHATGDSVIIELAGTALATLRNVDTIGRVGGSSFALALPETDMEASRQLAERLREKIADIDVPTNRGDHVHFSVSVGVASLVKEDLDAEGLLLRAETAMQRAKELGRNRVECDLPVTAAGAAPV